MKIIKNKASAKTIKQVYYYIYKFFNYYWIFVAFMKKIIYNMAYKYCDEDGKYLKVV